MVNPLPQIEAPQEGSELPVISGETEAVNEAENTFYRSEAEGHFGDKIEALLKEKPNLNGRQIAEIIGCSERTAYKWMKRVQVVSAVQNE